MRTVFSAAAFILLSSALLHAQVSPSPSAESKASTPTAEAVSVPAAPTLAVSTPVPAVEAAASTASVVSAQPTGLFPPPAPKHERRELSTVSEVGLDLAETLAFLEQGQTYFRVYQKGTHTPEENTRFLRFLEEHERERAVAQKEIETLRLWLQQRSDLESNP